MTNKPIDYEELALAYHEMSPSGKISIRNTKPLNSQLDLSLAYSPGVAGPCRVIAKNELSSYKYTGRGNLVGVISNGTAVLGLGDIGPFAAKPVMEGKAMLFKKFANIDVFDLEINAKDPDLFIQTVKSLEPTFGGINLEDIKAPECFYIEETLRKEMSIPVFHDDQHGTSIIAGAAFLNALEVTGRKIQNVKVVFSGAGAAAIACASLFKKLGVKDENLILCDSKGVIHTQRKDLNPYKQRFARDIKLRTLEEALKGADAFCGVSSAEILTPQMLLGMNKNPIVFALANPVPEIMPDLALKTRPDVIMATGRSDFPNQVNNVLGFPYIFRGALDVRATCINEEMKLAAVKAIAELTKEHVPEEVLAVYNTSSSYEFGRDYLIPKPVDQRVLLRVAPAVAKAAMESGAAQRKINLDKYQEEIEHILGPTRRIIRNLRKQIYSYTTKTQSIPRIVLPHGTNIRVLKAAKQAHDSGDVKIILLGQQKEIEAQAKQTGIHNLSGIEIIDPATHENLETYAQTLYTLRNRKGVSKTQAYQTILHHDYFAAVMVHLGKADAMITGSGNHYTNSVTPIIEVIGAKENHILAGVYMLVKDQQVTFFADCTINIDPNAVQLADIAISTAELAKIYTKDPVRVAMLSFGSFGTSRHPFSRKVAEAVKIIKKRNPELEVDGEMQADVALNPDLRKHEFPFCNLKGNANVLIFPDLGSANIAYKLLTSFDTGTPTGPILVGIKKPAHVVQQGASVQEIVNLIFVAAHQAVSAHTKK